MEYLHSQVYQFRKLIQACKAAVEELFRADRVNELTGIFRVRMKNDFFFQRYREKQRDESGSRFTKEPCALLQSQILIPGNLVIIDRCRKHVDIAVAVNIRRVY